MLLLIPMLLQPELLKLDLLLHLLQLLLALLVLPLLLQLLEVILLFALEELLLHPQELLPVLCVKRSRCTRLLLLLLLQRLFLPWRP